MPTYRAPGVHIDEVPRGPRRIEAVPTDLAAFVGVTGGDTDAALVTSIAEFESRWPTGTAVATAVELFLLGGGRQAWVAPVRRLTPKAVARQIEGMHRDATLVAIPSDPVAPPHVVGAAAAALGDRRAMLLLEGPWPGTTEAESAMLAGAASALGTDGADAAVFWPRVRRPTPEGTVEDVSPLGAVAGVFARTDRTRGVWKAPAGTHATLTGVSGPSIVVTAADQGVLNPLGVDVIRVLPRAGTVLWGARTLSSDPEWRYIPVRRTALFLEESIERGLDWVVFEPNDEPLWAAVRASVEDFLWGLFRAGALQGHKPEHAFFVRCDRTTMTQTDIDAGRLICQVGVALVRPAEFTVLRVEAQTATARP
ncbi:hypothetical protein GCM10022200_29330 [Microbacterium awajiense]|uniref:Tail sheath protein C-terminal domain-containing protein n=1 Tax=Microbacterium awajiense TaxID=415214 RepID=A0ABP7AYC7_9MICO